MIRTERMTLEPAPLAFIEALERRDMRAAERTMDLVITGDSFEGPQHWMRLRIRQLREAPALDHWLLHAMILAEPDGDAAARTMVGHCGYHGAPDDDGMVEIGYTVAPPFRRRGYALEAARGLIRHAFSHEGITRVRASIRPDNEPSLGLAGKLGFRRVGEQMDEIDGLEYLFEIARPER
jgi:RimJ/RimL family protein N-acetyltransferase